MHGFGMLRHGVCLLTLHHPPHPLFIYENELSRTAPASSVQKLLSGLFSGFLNGQPCLLWGGAAGKIGKIISTICETSALAGVPPRLPQRYFGLNSFKSTVNPVEP